MANKNTKKGYLLVDTNDDDKITGRYDNFEDAQSDASEGEKIFEVTQVWEVKNITKVEKVTITSEFSEEN